MEYNRLTLTLKWQIKAIEILDIYSDSKLSYETDYKDESIKLLAIITNIFILPIKLYFKYVLF